MQRSRILIADHHTLIAELCGYLLEREFDVVGIVRDGRTLVRTTSLLRPDIIIMEVGMPTLNGLDAAQQLRQVVPSVKVIFLTTNADREVAGGALRHGARGYLHKGCAAHEVLAAVREVAKGGIYLSSTFSKEDIAFSASRSGPLAEQKEPLTEREREVLQLLAEGNAMKNISAILNVTARTVAFHKYRIMEKLRVQNSAELVKYAIRTHMTTL